MEKQEEKCENRQTAERKIKMKIGNVDWSISHPQRLDHLAPFVSLLFYHYPLPHH